MADEKIRRLLSELEASRYRFSSLERAALEERYEFTTEELMRALVKYAQDSAKASISHFQVGAVGLTEDGQLFLGYNIEFEGASFAQTVHAEQFLVSWSRSNTNSPLSILAVSAPPCGHCRQFVCEFDPEGNLWLLIGDEPGVNMKGLLPRAFTPKDLKVEEPFFTGAFPESPFPSLEEAAQAAAKLSYVPYSKSSAGVAVQVEDGRIFAGSALENAAYNPGLPPLQAAIIRTVAEGAGGQKLVRAVLCQDDSLIDYEPQTRDLLRSLGLGRQDMSTIPFSVAGPR